MDFINKLSKKILQRVGRALALRTVGKEQSRQRTSQLVMLLKDKEAIVGATSF